MDFGGGRVDTVSLDDVAPKGLQQSVENSREDSGPVDRPNEDSGPLDSPNEDSGPSSSSPNSNSNSPGSSPAENSQSENRDENSQSKRRSKKCNCQGRDSPSRSIPEIPEVPDELESEVEAIPETSRRRPGRSRKPPVRFGDYVPWDEISD